MYAIRYRRDKVSNAAAKEIALFLKKKGIKIKEGIKKLDKQDIILAIGDDDLILETFRMLGARQNPVLGISLGASFLAEAKFRDFRSYLDLLQRKKYMLVERTRLVARFQKTPIALNDIGQL